MKIFFDHQAFSFQNYGGISRYFCELITRINNIAEDEAHLSLLWSNNVHLKEYNIPVLSYPFKNKYSRLLHKPNQLYNYIDYKTNTYDIYHATYFDNFLSKRIGTNPFIVTFYDMIYERLSSKFTELSQNKTIVSQKKEIAEQATHIIAISESTKQDMIDLLDIQSEKISVIYLGSAFEQEDILVNQRNTFSYTNPYILYVGRRYGYKNFIPFLKAVANILIKHKVRLICAGGDDFSVHEKNLINSLNITKLVEYRIINDTSLKDLYINATAFIFPSLYEGFGLPVLEAFACKCPCVLSNTTSLPEIAGNAAAYFDPNEIDSMASVIENVIIDESLRSTLIQSGTLQLLNFSWDKTVQNTLDLYSKFC